MKSKLILLLLIIGSSFYAQAQIKSAEILASGLTCSMCSKAIYKALDKIPFVDTVKVNIETSTYIVDFKKGETVQIEQLRDAVYDAGFAIDKMQLLANWDEKLAAKDAVFGAFGYQFKWQLNANKSIASPQKVTIVNKDVQPINGVYLLKF